MTQAALVKPASHGGVDLGLVDAEWAWFWPICRAAWLMEQEFPRNCAPPFFGGHASRFGTVDQIADGPEGRCFEGNNWTHYTFAASTYWDPPGVDFALATRYALGLNDKWGARTLLGAGVWNVGGVYLNTNPDYAFSVVACPTAPTKFGITSNSNFPLDVPHTVVGDVLGGTVRVHVNGNNEPLAQGPAYTENVIGRPPSASDFYIGAYPLGGGRITGRMYAGYYLTRGLDDAEQAQLAADFYGPVRAADEVLHDLWFRPLAQRYPALPAPVTVDLLGADGAALAGVTVSAKLERAGVDTHALMTREVVSAVTDASGRAELWLWPSEEGLRRPRYHFWAVSQETGATLLNTYARVPRGGGQLRDLLAADAREAH